MGFFDFVTKPIEDIVGGVGSIASNVLGAGASAALGSLTGTPTTKQITNAADPFSSQRAQYQEMLQRMMTGTFTPSDPSYAWRFKQGQQAVERSMAAKGLLNSGNFLTALTDYGQGQASTEYSNQYSRLARLAGADIGSPSSAAQALANQQASQTSSNTAFGNLIGQSLGSLLGGGSALSSLGVEALLGTSGTALGGGSIAGLGSLGGLDLGAGAAAGGFELADLAGLLLL